MPASENSLPVEDRAHILPGKAFTFGVLWGCGVVGLRVRNKKRKEEGDTSLVDKQCSNRYTNLL